MTVTVKETKGEKNANILHFWIKKKKLVKVFVYVFNTGQVDAPAMKKKKYPYLLTFHGIQRVHLLKC